MVHIAQCSCSPCPIVNQFVFIAFQSLPTCGNSSTTRKTNPVLWCFEILRLVGGDADGADCRCRSSPPLGPLTHHFSEMGTSISSYSVRHATTMAAHIHILHVPVDHSRSACQFICSRPIPDQRLVL